MKTFLVDNSVWQKASRSPVIAARLRHVASRHRIITCPPQVLEYCFSARSSGQFATLRADMDRLYPARFHPSEADALDIQQALWNSGRIRAAGTADCLIAAYALLNNAIILNSDRDFGHIEAAMDGKIKQEFVPEA